MQLDAHGNALAGHGGPGWFLNGAAILAPPAGNDPVFWQGRALGNDGAALVSTDLAGGDRVILDARGCSRIYSDGAAWGAFLQDGATGVYTSWGLALPAGEAYGLAAGVLYGRPVFQSAGGLAAWAVGETDPARVLWTDPAAEVVEFAAHPTRPNAVIWTDGRRQLHAHGIAPPAQAEDCFAPRIVERRPGDLYLLEWREGVGLIVRPWADADHGWIVFGDVAWGAAARVDTAGRDTVEIAFSLNPAGPATCIARPSRSPRRWSRSRRRRSSRRSIRRSSRSIRRSNRQIDRSIRRLNRRSIRLNRRNRRTVSCKSHLPRSRSSRIPKP